jgi:hypothetical protein
LIDVCCSADILIADGSLVLKVLEIKETSVIGTCGGRF